MSAGRKSYYIPKKTAVQQKRRTKTSSKKSTTKKSRRTPSIRITQIGQVHALYLSVLFACMTAFGLIILLSASSVAGHFENGDALGLFRRQLTWAAIGAVGFFVASRLDYRLLRKVVIPMLVVSVGLLVAVLIPGVGINANGSSRWLGLGPLVIQPAEIAKFVLVVFIAHLLTLRERRMNRPEMTVRPTMLVLATYSLLLLLQPKLGTIVVLGLTSVIMLFVAGSRLRYLTGWAAAGGAVFTAAVLTSDHAVRRLQAFIDPLSNLDAGAFQPVQSQVAAASGGLTGVGIGAGRAKYGFLPEVESDFIFANLAEETGLVGSTAVIGFYLLVAWFGFRAAMNAPERFGMLLAAGFTALITMQAFLNIGVVIGVLPTTGVPLPFVSAGGSSLVMMLTAAGIITNVARRAKVKT